MKYEKTQYDKRHNNDSHGTKMPYKVNENKILNNKVLFICSYKELHLKFGHLT